MSSNKTLLDRSKDDVEYGRNQMLFDFGLSPEHFDNPEKVTQKIKDIEEQFDLILISEDFAKSMVLLKDLLCLNVYDVTYLVTNRQIEKIRTTISEKVSTCILALI